LVEVIYVDGVVWFVLDEASLQPTQKRGELCHTTTQEAGVFLFAGLVGLGDHTGCGIRRERFFGKVEPLSAVTR